jgi:hypothetical protein
MSFFKRPFWVVTIIATLSFLPLLLLEGQHAFDLLDWLTVAVGIGIIIGYLPSLIRARQLTQWEPGHIFVIGIFSVQVAQVSRHFWQWIWRYFGKPDWMLDHWFLLVTIWLFFIGGVMHLIVSDVVEGKIPRENWVRVGIAVAVGLGAFGIIIFILEPNIREGTPMMRHPFTSR